MDFFLFFSFNLPSKAINCDYQSPFVASRFEQKFGVQCFLPSMNEAHSSSFFLRNRLDVVGIGIIVNFSNSLIKNFNFLFVIQLLVCLLIPYKYRSSLNFHFILSGYTNFSFTWPHFFHNKDHWLILKETLGDSAIFLIYCDWKCFLQPFFGSDVLYLHSCYYKLLFLTNNNKGIRQKD